MNATEARSTSRRVDRTLIFLEALVGIAVVVAIVGKTYGTASTLTFVIAALAVAYTCYVLLKMVTVLKDETLDLPRRMTDSRRQQLEEEKWLLLQGIKEFEADAAQGKVDKEDYEHLRRTAESRALEIIRELKESDQRYLEKANALVAKRLGHAVSPEPAKKASAPAAQEKKTPSGDSARLISKDGRLHCSVCDAEGESDARFCVGCGRRLAPEEGLA